MYHQLLLRPQRSEEEPPPQLHIQDRISYRNLVNDRRYSPEDVLQEPELTNEEPEEEDNDSEDSEEDD